ncbi:uncharacterized protein [Dermacentor albipictus]|uniref:uncharacterized protein n=1 Tax=Dermacentor albipictus TaxID=60249 RepID=UPI0031FE1E10
MAGTKTFTCELDASSNCPASVVWLRVDLCTAEDAYEWIASYSRTTNTTWIVDWEVRNPKRMVFHKKWRCQHSNLNKTAGLKSTNCSAFVDIKIKAVTKQTQRNDSFLKREHPLCAIVKLKEDHNHELSCADGLRLLRSSADTRATFHSYFKDGLAPAESLQLHQQKLAVEDDGVQQLANGALNPSANTVYHWFRMWRKDNYGDELDPLSKLEEKAPLYHQNGVNVSTTKSKDGNCWAVLVVTRIMQRTQGLEAASEIIFLDSTASCDESQATVTVVLTATPVGAIPIAVLMHNSQTTESYKTAFGLLKQKYPFCFGGLHTPQSFMTDNSSAEKAALKATWSEATQLLCHFHVAQAEWRWLHASSSSITRDERRELMTAFQKVMYASSAEELAAATEELLRKPHRAYVTRVRAFLERKEEWVLFFRLSLMTRGHNTNNYAEATIRVLKDVVLGRQKAYNVVALVDLVATVWEDYFSRRLLNHAYNRVPAHQIFYSKLVHRMPESVAQSVCALGDSLYQVPSGQEDGKIYHVWQDVGTCTCRNGQQGAFCKHQALVHSIYGGGFPNAPILKPDDRHKLGILALGDKCPDKSFFGSFREVLPELPSTSTAQEVRSQHAPEPQDEPIELDQHHLECSNSNERRQDAAEVLKQIQEEEWRYYSLAADNTYYLTVLEQVLAEMKKVHKEPQVIASYLAQKAAFTSARRRGRTIKVQPTGIARRRPGVGRGSGRLREGRPSKHQKAKRAHALHLSVKCGVPHAKSHGTRH